MKKSNVSKQSRPGVAVFLKGARKALKKHKIKGIKVFCSMNADGQIDYDFEGDKGGFREARIAIISEMNPSNKSPLQRE